PSSARASTHLTILEPRQCPSAADREREALRASTCSKTSQLPTRGTNTGLALSPRIPGEQQQSLRSDTLNPRHLWPSRAEILCTRLARLPRRRAPAKQLDAASTATIHSPTIALQSRQQLGST